MNKVVARFLGDNLIKGTTNDFFSGAEVFHLSLLGAPAEDKPIEIYTNNLKALFFVKDFLGNSQLRQSERIRSEISSDRTQN